MPSTISLALRLAAAAQLVLVAVLLLRDHRRSRVTVASSVLVGCVVCYLAIPALLHAAVPQALLQIARAGALGVPFAFWLAARLYFDDAFQPGPAHGAILLGLLAARALVLPWPMFASGIAMVIVLDALRRILAGTGSDLLLSRLRLRYAVLLGTGVYALLVLIAEATLARGSRAEALLSAVNDVGLFGLILVISTMVLRVEPDLVRAAVKRPVPEDVPTVLEKRLDLLIEEEQVFKVEGLTIGALAGRLGEQEYRLRRHINRHLGFRNFGAFLNHYRVREACKLLGDPAQKGLGVAEIAYRYGYSSLGPFNRAFKEIVGQTPTEYRRAAQEREILADSGAGAASSKKS